MKRARRGCVSALVLLVGSGGVFAQESIGKGGLHQRRVVPDPAQPPEPMQPLPEVISPPLLEAFDTTTSITLKTQLVEELGREAEGVDVTARQGIVRLSGTVATLRAQRRPVELAHGMRGVRAVVNQLQVRPPLRSDAHVQSDVEARLQAQPDTRQLPVRADVVGGTAVLTGMVDTWQQRATVEDIARAVPGVLGVRNAVRVVHATERLPVDIVEEIRRNLAGDPRVDGEGVGVRVEEDTVILDGVVSSRQERERVVRHAQVRGVQAVEAEGLVVDPDVVAARAPVVELAEQPVPDDAILTALRDAFRVDPRISEGTMPGFTVERGVVTLGGPVDSLRAARAAEQDAWNTVGVITVYNRMRVEPPGTIADARIAAAIVGAIRQDPWVDARDVEVSVEQGRVLLRGQVPATFMRDHAEDLAVDTRGVVAVRNQLQVLPPGVARGVGGRLGMAASRRQPGD